MAAFWTRIVSFIGGGCGLNWRNWLRVSAILSVWLLILWATSGWQWVLLRNVWAGLLVAAAAAAVGVLLGFLFGIPRSLQQEEAAAAGNGLPYQSFRANTNLEQISDWLTKIIIGVGLVQAGKIIEMVKGVAKDLGPLFAIPANTTNENGVAYVLVLMVLFSVLGFLGGYLWARIYLQEEFSDMAQRAERQPEYFEGLMNAYLYKPAPKGFEKALELRNAYEKRVSESLTDRMWTYTTLALGQQYAYWEETKAKTEAELKAARAKFIETLKTALRLDREARALLRLEIEPDDRMPVELFEGDLRSFAKDDEVKALLRKDTTVPI